MIKQFSTPPIEAGKPSSDSGKSNTLLIVAGVLVLGYLAYRFILKPKMEETAVVYEDADYTTE